MGCTQSTQGGNVESLEDFQLRSNEQQNLLRYKIEVLVNMLAVEEKKSKSAEKRLETLKWLLHSKGISEQTFANIMKTADTSESISSKNADLKDLALIDLNGAIGRMLKDFEQSKPDIIQSFADSDGKIVPFLTELEFSKQLYTVTEQVSKTDIQILAIRFSDGSGHVWIPEFLEFFTTPPQIRLAKASTAAVRMSLDLMDINAEIEEDGDGDYEEFEVGENTVITHKTEGLERAVAKLIGQWPFVKEDLEVNFFVYKPLTTVTIEVFKKILTDICSKKSKVLRRLVVDAKITLDSVNVSPAPVKKVKSQSSAAESKHGEGRSEEGKENDGDEANKSSADGGNEGKSADGGDGGKPLSVLNTAPVPVESLDGMDVDLITIRFELGDVIDYVQFSQYFDHMYATAKQFKKKQAIEVLPSRASPFRFSSEWSNLCASASVNAGKKKLAKEASVTQSQEAKDQPAAGDDAKTASAGGVANDAPKRMRSNLTDEAETMDLLREMEQQQNDGLLRPTPSKEPSIMAKKEKGAADSATKPTPVKSASFQETKKSSPESKDALQKNSADAKSEEGKDGTDGAKPEGEAKETPAPEEPKPPAAEVVKSSGCFWCSGGKKQPANEPAAPPSVDAPDAAADATTPAAADTTADAKDTASDSGGEKKPVEDKGDKDTGARLKSPADDKHSLSISDLSSVDERLLPQTDTKFKTPTGDKAKKKAHFRSSDDLEEDREEEELVAPVVQSGARRVPSAQNVRNKLSDNSIGNTHNTGRVPSDPVMSLEDDSDEAEEIDIAVRNSRNPSTRGHK